MQEARYLAKTADPDQMLLKAATETSPGQAIFALVGDYPMGGRSEEEEALKDESQSAVFSSEKGF